MKNKVENNQDNEQLNILAVIYSDSKTFDDGEKVVKWNYCKDCV